MLTCSYCRHEIHQDQGTSHMGTSVCHSSRQTCSDLMQSDIDSLSRVVNTLMELLCGIEDAARGRVTSVSIIDPTLYL